MIVDCMACLVALSQGLPEGGVYRGGDDVTHATVRSKYLEVVTCSLRRDRRRRYWWDTHQAVFVLR